ncbi:DsbA family protein [Roseomonas sp. USHLN139]|uniref:DsbA family protein n=1 Tax=Roseomonas sp. USHLN139 TaxID=3081298 RepID=UPI003B02543A
MPTLHYIHDPLCGWCYAASPLVAAAAALPGMIVALHGGGLWDPPTGLPPAKRSMIAAADARIAQLSGQVFGAAYLEGLLQDPATVFDSRPVTAALLAAGEQALPMLRLIQTAHYVEGLRVVEPEVLAGLAARLGVDGFAARLSAVDVDGHIAATRRLMQRIGAGGFPTFLLESEAGLRPVPHSDCYGDVPRFVQRLA